MSAPLTPPRVGVDLCGIGRLEKSLQSEAFVARVFAPAEQALLKALPPARRAQSAAANFAAKEAFLKAAGLGLGGLPMAQIAVLRAPSGAPYLQFSGQAAAWMAQNGLQAGVSLSHEGGLACAVVLLTPGKKSAGV